VFLSPKRLCNVLTFYVISASLYPLTLRCYENIFINIKHHNYKHVKPHQQQNSAPEYFTVLDNILKCVHQRKWSSKRIEHKLAVLVFRCLSVYFE